MRGIALAAALVTAAVAAAYALWPVCVPIPAADAASFDPPIAERTETMLWGRVFQQRSGQWQQCKTRISRAFFF